MIKTSLAILSTATSSLEVSQVSHELQAHEDRVASSRLQPLLE